MEPVVREITIEGPVDEVWRVVTEELGAWLGAEVDFDARVGGPISVRWPDGSTSRGLVEIVEPPVRFGFRWRQIADAVDSVRIEEPTRVEFALESRGEARTSVTVTEADAPVPKSPLSMGARA